MKSFIFPLLLLVLFGCSKETKNNKSHNLLHIKVDLGKKNNLMASSVFSSITPIFLETTDENTISTVEKIEIQDSNIYLWDGYNSYGDNVLSAFDSSGKFKFDIRKTGYGPGEYLYPHGIYVDDSGIELFDVGQRKMIRYDLSGNLQTEKPMNSEAVSFMKFKEEYISYAGIETADIYHPSNANMNLYNLNFYDNDFKLIKQTLPITTTSTFAAMVGNRNFEVQDNNLFFFRILSDTVYRIEDREIVPAYIFDFSPYNIPNSFIKRHINEKIIRLLKETNYAYGLQNVRITTNHIYSQFYYGDKKYHLIYNLESGNLLYSEQILNDINLFFLGDVVGADDDNLYFITYPYELIKYYKNLKKEYKSKFDQHLNSKNLKMPELNDNPIIIRAKLK